MAEKRHAERPGCTDAVEKGFAESLGAVEKSVRARQRVAESGEQVRNRIGPEHRVGRILRVRIGPRVIGVESSLLVVDDGFPECRTGQHKPLVMLHRELGLSERGVPGSGPRDALKQSRPAPLDQLWHLLLTAGMRLEPALQTPHDVVVIRAPDAFQRRFGGAIKAAPKQRAILGRTVHGVRVLLVPLLSR
eukprot:scaffold301_cov243-Pinguiococcus_pyrenoidosus.AAC.127